MRFLLPLLVLAGCSAGTVAEEDVSTGWQITVYYTAVETFHSGQPQQVRGCLKIECEHGDDVLGTYPGSFVQAVQDEGTGRSTSGAYLNWSYDKGFWLDTAPRDTNGKPLEPFVSAAADGLAQGTQVRIVSCGQPEEPTVCEKLMESPWRISDAFTPGLGGERHIDLYLGEENGPRFTESAWYATFAQAVLQTF